MAPATVQRKLFSAVSFTPGFILAQACTKGRCSTDKTLHRKALIDGIRKVEDSLDVVKIVQNSRALNTLLRLLLTSDERRLIKVQRRQTVLEPLLKSSDDDKMS